MSPRKSTQKQVVLGDRRTFTDEFKAGAVRLVLDEGRSITSVARDLNLVPSVLQHWVAQANANAGHGPAEAPTRTEREELMQLRRENRVLKMEHEILKEAAAFFAKEKS